MNERVNKFLLAGDKFIPEMNLKQRAFTYSACDQFAKTKKEFKNLCKQEVQIIFTRMILMKFVFNMIWLMVNIKN